MQTLVELGSLGRPHRPETPLSPFPRNLGKVKKGRAAAQSTGFSAVPSPIASPSHLCPSSPTQRNWGAGSHPFLLPRASPWPEHAAAPGSRRLPARGKSYRVPGSLAPGFSAARKPRGRLLRRPRSSNKNRGCERRSSRRLSRRPPGLRPPARPAAAGTRSGGSHHTKAPCASRSGTGGGDAGHRIQAGQRGRPHAHPPGKGHPSPLV